MDAHSLSEIAFAVFAANMATVAVVGGIIHAERRVRSGEPLPWRVALGVGLALGLTALTFLNA